jgi:S-layer protein
MRPLANAADAQEGALMATMTEMVARFQNIHLGRAPTTAETAILQGVAASTDSAQNTAIVNTADVDTSVALQAYQFFTGATPSQAGFAFLTNSPTNGSDLNDAYYRQFNIENRYINFAANLGIQGEGAAAFQAAFASLTFAQAVSLAYGKIIGYNYAQALGVNPELAVADISGRIGYFQAVAQAGLPTANQDLATKAAMVGYIMAEGIKADVGAYAAGSNAFMTDLLDGTAQFNVNLVGIYSPMTPTGAPNTPVPTPPPSDPTYDFYSY